MYYSGEFRTYKSWTCIGGTLDVLVKYFYYWRITVSWNCFEKSGIINTNTFNFEYHTAEFLVVRCQPYPQCCSFYTFTILVSKLTRRSFASQNCTLETEILSWVKWSSHKLRRIFFFRNRCCTTSVRSLDFLNRIWQIKCVLGIATRCRSLAPQ